MSDVEEVHEFWDGVEHATAAAEQAAEENEDVLEVVEASRPATLADLTTGQRDIIASLALCGFWSASQVTVALLHQKPFKTGSRAGEERPDKLLTNVFIHAAHPDRRYVAAWYQDDKLKSANIGLAHGPVRVVETVKELTAHIEGGDA